MTTPDGKGPLKNQSGWKSAEERKPSPLLTPEAQERARVHRDRNAPLQAAATAEAKRLHQARVAADEARLAELKDALQQEESTLLDDEQPTQPITPPSQSIASAGKGSSKLADKNSSWATGKRQP